MIQPIVEGQGDVGAVPVLLRRLRDESAAWSLQIGKPIRQHRSALVNKAPLQKAVGFAALQPQCSGILIIFDADDDCPMDLAPVVEQWATEVARGLPVQVVMPNREFEAWFLAGIESLRGFKAVRADAERWIDPEAPRDAKGQMKTRMIAGASYSATVDQASFASKIDLSIVFSRSRSFRKLVTSFGRLATLDRQWPPAEWLDM
jgi:hypothetical protein